MEMTCISLTLDLAQQELQKRRLTVPEHLSLNWDNTAREGKNQHQAKYQAWLVSTGRFRSVQFHPEASPGPVDTAYLFDEFAGSIKP
jgi:carbamoylphosphate synthase small subunit